MITVSNLGMQFGGQWLFQHVDLQFLPGNCYGIIGANGAGKSTFLRILTGELDSTSGAITIDPDKRVSVLKQNQNAYDEFTIMDTVIMGNQHLYDVMKEKDAIYEKEDFSDEDGIRAAELEAEFAEMDGWEAESDASRLLQGDGQRQAVLGSLDAKQCQIIGIRCGLIVRLDRLLTRIGFHVGDLHGSGIYVGHQNTGGAGLVGLGRCIV